MIGVTGLSGFVGKNLEKQLSRSHSLVGFNRSDLRNIHSESLLNCNSIIHLVGKVHDLRNSTAAEEYYKINFELTKILYDNFLKSEAKNFIFISSVKAVADSTLTALTESFVANPQTHYGKSKLLAEQYIQSQALPPGKSYYILRPCMIHGPGNKGNLNLLYKFVSKGIPYPLAAFENKRSFLSVENLCFIIREILERDDIPSGIYNVADDEPLSTNEVVSLLAKAQKRSARLLNIPQGLIKLFAKIGDKFHLPLSTERLQKLTENFVVSNNKIKTALKKELPLSAREGILRTARSFTNA